MSKSLDKEVLDAAGRLLREGPDKERERAREAERLMELAKLLETEEIMRKLADLGLPDEKPTKKREKKEAESAWFLDELHKL